jgi:hypothetical protein
LALHDFIELIKVNWFIYIIRSEKQIINGRYKLN